MNLRCFSRLQDSALGHLAGNLLGRLAQKELKIPLFVSKQPRDDGFQSMNAKERPLFRWQTGASQEKRA